MGPFFALRDSVSMRAFSHRKREETARNQRFGLVFEDCSACREAGSGRSGSGCRITAERKRTWCARARVRSAPDRQGTRRRLGVMFPARSGGSRPSGQHPADLAGAFTGAGQGKAMSGPQGRGIAGGTWALRRDGEVIAAVKAGWCFAPAGGRRAVKWGPAAMPTPILRAPLLCGPARQRQTGAAWWLA